MKGKPRKNAQARITWAIGELAWYALACAILAGVIYSSEGHQIAKEGGLALGQIIAVYAAVAIVSGVILGLLIPLVKGTLSALLVSIPVAFPAALTILWLSEDRDISRFTGTDVGIAVAIAVIAGPLIATYMRLRTANGKEGGTG